MYYFIRDKENIEKKVIDALCATLIPYLILKKVTINDKGGFQIYKKELDLPIANG
jgi:hypothetical protein